MTLLAIFTLAVLIDKLEERVEVAGLFVVGLLVSVLKKDERWVATDTVVTAQLLLHCAVNLGERERGGGGKDDMYRGKLV